MGENVSHFAPVLPTIGYQLVPFAPMRSSGGYYWSTVPMSGVHCPDCYSARDLLSVSQDVLVSARKDVVSADGRPIVSARFREFCVSERYEHLSFHRIAGKGERYELRSSLVLEVDVERSSPVLAEFCRRCGNFECYLEGAGLFFHRKRPLSDGIYRTDLIWGCRAGKHPLIIVGIETRAKIKAAKFTGVSFRAVPYMDPSYHHRKAIRAETSAGLRSELNK